MAVNPYVVPARYQYQPLPANFLLEAGMRKQGQFDAAKAGIEDFKSKLAIEPGYQTVEKAKLVEDKYLSELQPLVEDFYKTGDVSSIVPKLSALQTRFRQDPDRIDVQNDFELKSLGAKVLSDPNLNRTVNTLLNPDGSIRQLKPNERANPQNYAALPEATLRSSFDEYAKEINPEVIYKDGIPTQVKIDDNPDGTPRYADITKTTTVNQLTEQYFRNRFKNLTESGRYKETPFYRWYTGFNKTDIDPKQMEDLLVNEYATKFFHTQKDDYSSRNVTGQPTGKAGKEEKSFFQDRYRENLPNEYISSSLKDVLAKDNKNRLQTILDGAKYDSAEEDAKLARTGHKVNRNPETGDITGIESTTSKSLSKSDEAQKIFDENAKRNRAEGMQRLAGTLEDDVQALREQYGINDIPEHEQGILNVMNEFKNTSPSVLNDIKKIGKKLLNRYGLTTLTPEDLKTNIYGASHVAADMVDNITIDSEGKKWYVGADLEPMPISEETYQKGLAAKEYYSNIDKYRNIQSKYDKYEDAENKMIEDKLSGYDRSINAYIFEDEKENGRPEDVAFASVINSHVMSGNARGVDPEADVPDYNSDNSLKWDTMKEFMNPSQYEFNPQNFYPKDGKWYARGRFESITKGENAVKNSENIDVDITGLIQDKLPTEKNIQEAVYGSIQDQLQYIPNGEASTIKLFGNDIKVTRSDDGQNIDIAPGSFFEFNPQTGKMGLNEETKTYSNSGEASFDILQGAFREQQLREARPYYFEKISDNRFKYVGDTDPKEVSERKDLVEKSSKDWANTFGWGDAYADKLKDLIGFETNHTYSTKIGNPISGATGLIQFYPDGEDTVNGVKRPYKVIGVGSSKRKYYLDDIAKMSIAEQFLGPITDYFDESKSAITTPDDLYMAVISPNGILKTDKYQNASEEDRKKFKLKEFNLIDKFYLDNDAWFKKNATLEERKNTTIGELQENVFGK